MKVVSSIYESISISDRQLHKENRRHELEEQMGYKY